MIGTRIGAYEVIGSLGAGGMGEVYRARDSKLGRDVALTILPDAFASDPERLARFEREAKTLASLNHPHIGHITKPEAGSAHMPESWSPTGAQLLFTVANDGVVTLWTLAIADQHAERFAGVRSLAPTSAAFSPDGRWVAYATTDVGRPTSIVSGQPFPATGAIYQVSRDNDGHPPVWSRDGTELSFVPAPGQLVRRVEDSRAHQVNACHE